MRLQELPLPSIPKRDREKSRRWLEFVGVTTAALLVGFLGAWQLFDTQHPENDQRTIAEAPPTRPGVVANERLLAKFADYNLALADTADAGEQLAIFARMAEDLKNEALRLAREDRTEELLPITRLYEFVVRRGLPGRIGCLSDLQRREQFPELIRSLEMDEREVRDAAKYLPDRLADLIEPISKASAALVRHLNQNGTEHEPFPIPSIQQGIAGTDWLLLSVLVTESVIMVEDADSLQRAASCTGIADHLSRAVQTASVMGDRERAANFSKILRGVLDRGIGDNLTRWQQEEPDDEQRQQVRARFDEVRRAVDRLERDLLIGGRRNGATESASKAVENATNALEKSLNELSKKDKKGKKDTGKKDKKDKKENGKKVSDKSSKDKKHHDEANVRGESNPTPEILPLPREESN